jgi:thiosulfate/3-mercaptopyruvate sulfurtransferase
MMEAKFGTAGHPGIRAGRLDKSACGFAQQVDRALWETKKAARPLVVLENCKREVVEPLHTTAPGDTPMPARRGLVTTAELAASLGQPNLRIFDCTTTLEYLPPGSDMPYVAVPGRHTFEAAHIPGADFLDLQGEFSDPTTPLRFMMPPAAQLEAAFGRHGIGADSHVVLYSIGTMMWATRFWWMLRSLGFENASVLDGGFDKWTAEGRPTESGPATGYPTADFVAAPRPGFFVDKHQVLAAGGSPETVVVNALGPQFHSGLEPSRYGRPGRIPGSVNVPAATLLDPATKAFIPLAEAEAKFASQGITREKRVIAYCGGGISATIDLFLLDQLGYDQLTLYDGSMGEWAKDSSLPIETD